MVACGLNKRSINRSSSSPDRVNPLRVLKGGDTAIFARTAEEVEELEAAAIPYEIVPGITAAMAATAYAGIPLTHRDWASAVAFVTGQMQPTDGSNEAEILWTGRLSLVSLAR